MTKAYRKGSLTLNLAHRMDYRGPGIACRATGRNK